MIGFGRNGEERPFAQSLRQGIAALAGPHVHQVPDGVWLWLDGHKAKVNQERQCEKMLLECQCIGGAAARLTFWRSPYARL